MKKLILSLILATVAYPCFSQAVLHRDSVLQDPSQSLISSKVIELGSLSQSEIKNRVKNWAGKSFVNMNEVLVSETENQVVFRYIESYHIKYMGSVVTSGEYTRLVVQIKDGKAKFSFFDDGHKDNGIKITDAFKEKELIKDEGREKFSYCALKSYRENVGKSIQSLEKGLLNNLATLASEDF